MSHTSQIQHQFLQRQHVLSSASDTKSVSEMILFLSKQSFNKLYVIKTSIFTHSQVRKAGKIILLLVLIGPKMPVRSDFLLWDKYGLDPPAVQTPSPGFPGSPRCPRTPTLPLGPGGPGGPIPGGPEGPICPNSPLEPVSPGRPLSPFGPRGPWE